MANHRLVILSEHLAVCKLKEDACIPQNLAGLSFFSLTRTADEVSLVLPEKDIPSGSQVELGWRAVKMVGPLDFALTGILASLAEPLARAGISIFAISTYDTDYILVRSGDLDQAVQTLTESGSIFVQ